MGSELLRPSDRLHLVGVIDPDANAAATLLTVWVNAGLYESFMAMISAGDLGTNGTLDAKLRQATSSAGAGAKDITGKAITQMTEAGTNLSNKQAFINLESEDLDTNNGFSWVALSVTGAVATSDFAAYLFGLNAKYPDAAHISSVIEEVGGQ